VITGRDMITGVQEILHDTGRGYATAARFYDPNEIIRRLNEAKGRIATLLLKLPEPAWCPASRLIVSQVVTDGTTMPSNFFTLLGLTKTTTNAYVPASPMSKGEPLFAQGLDYCFVRGGIYHGPAGVALYEAWASEAIADTQIPLTEFPDGAYFMIVMLAARECLPQEKSDALDRWKLLSIMLGEELISFAPLMLNEAVPNTGGGIVAKTEIAQ